MNIEFAGSNIGCVIYKKVFNSGELEANWNLVFDNKILSGTGKATGEPGNEYAGKYKIKYYRSDGTESDYFDLVITETNGFFLLQWFQNGVIKCSGIGMPTNDLLIAGWKREQKPA